MDLTERQQSYVDSMRQFADKCEQTPELIPSSLSLHVFPTTIKDAVAAIVALGEPVAREDDWVRGRVGMILVHINIPDEAFDAPADRTLSPEITEALTAAATATEIREERENVEAEASAA